MIIGISGYKGSGKDLVADIIMNYSELKYENKKFAAKLKSMASLMTGVPIEKWEDQDFKESNMPIEWDRLATYGSEGASIRRYPTTYRQFLQQLGTDAVRLGLHYNAWVNALFADYKLGDKWIVSDVRFENEASAIKHHGGIVIRVDRGIKNTDMHPSETAMDDYNFDWVINNTGSIRDLVTEVYFFYDKFIKHE